MSPCSDRRAVVYCLLCAYNLGRRTEHPTVRAAQADTLEVYAEHSPDPDIRDRAARWADELRRLQ